MSTADLKAITTGKEEKPKDFPAMLNAWLPEIKRALPKHLNADRMSRIALTAFRRTPKLAECDPRSVFAAVIQAAQLGLEPDTLGRSYLIPYSNRKKTPNGWTSVMECQFVPGWKGLMDLMNRSGQGSAWTGAVFDGDEFDYQLGDSPYVRHKPMGEDNIERLTHVYAVGRAKNAEWPVIEVWTVARVRKHRDRYNKVGEKHYSYENFEMYARKVVLLQVLKYMPCSPELSIAMALNDAAEIGAQKIDLKEAIEGTWEPVAETQEPPAQPDQAATHSTAAPQDGATAGAAGPTLDDVLAIVKGASEMQDAAAATIRLDDARNLLQGLSAKDLAKAKAAISKAQDEIEAKATA